MGIAPADDGKYYKLTGNIDLQNALYQVTLCQTWWTQDWDGKGYFTKGNYIPLSIKLDGAGFTVSNLRVSCPNNSYGSSTISSLFGMFSGTLKNITFSSITMTHTSTSATGILFVEHSGLAQRVNIVGSSSYGLYTSTGGFAQKVTGVVRECSIVDTRLDVGISGAGIALTADASAVIENCLVLRASIYAGAGNVAGLVVSLPISATGCTIRNCFTAFTMQGNSRSLGVLNYPVGFGAQNVFGDKVYAGGGTFLGFGTQLSTIQAQDASAGAIVRGLEQGVGAGKWTFVQDQYPTLATVSAVTPKASVFGNMNNCGRTLIS